MFESREDTANLVIAVFSMVVALITAMYVSSRMGRLEKRYKGIEANCETVINTKLNEISNRCDIIERGVPREAADHRAGPSSSCAASSNTTATLAMFDEVRETHNI